MGCDKLHASYGLLKGGEEFHQEKLKCGIKLRLELKMPLNYLKQIY